MLELGSDSVTIVAVIGVVALAALVCAATLRRQVLAAGDGTAAMQDIARGVQEGASAYLNRQFRTLALFAIVVFALLFLLPGDGGIRIGRSVAFLVGAGFSAAIGYLGMWLAVRANVRVAAAATRPDGRAAGARIAFRTGGVVGMSVVGLGLLGASVVVLVYRTDAPAVLEGFGFGAALLAMFMRVGGGIFTKAADVGADLVGKVEAGIPEDDPRNPAVIADNVGDNVGDCAGMAADLFETYVVTVGATMVLTALLMKGVGELLPNLMALPLLIGGVCIVTSIIGTYFVRLGGGKNVMGAMYKGFLVSAVLAIPAIWVATDYALGGMGANLPGTEFNGRELFYCALLGLVITGLIIWITEYYTGTGFRPVRSIASAMKAPPSRRNSVGE